MDNNKGLGVSVFQKSLEIVHLKDILKQSGDLGFGRGFGKVEQIGRSCEFTLREVVQVIVDA